MKLEVIELEVFVKEAKKVVSKIYLIAPIIFKSSCVWRLDQQVYMPIKLCLKYGTR